MEDWFKYLITQSVSHYFIIIILVTFLESLALIGLLLPGIVFMTTIGTLIGQEKIPFYPAWIIGIIGCLLGDYLSYYIGLIFKKWIYKINLFNKNIILFNKIQKTLYQYSTFTIFIGKFIGPIRPLVTMIAGMIKLPIKKFILPSLMASILWPLLYFLPGIITGVILNNPNYHKNNIIKWVLIIVCLNIWMGCFLLWKYWNKNHKYGILKKIKTKYLILIAITNLIIGIIGLIYIQKNMKVLIVKEIIYKILNL